MSAKEDAHTLTSSSKWLKTHGLKKKKLSMMKILSQLGFQQKEDYVSKLGRPVSSRYSQGLFPQYNFAGKIYNLTAKKEQFLQKVESLTNTIELYNERLGWLTSGSRAIFGVIQENSVIFVLECGCLSKEQFEMYQDAFCLLIREQVAHISNFNIIWVSQVPEKWHDKQVHVSQDSIETAVEWVHNTQHPPVENPECAANALSEALLYQVEAVYYFTAEDISEVKKQLLLKYVSDSPCPVHFVSYNPQKEETITFLKEISHQTSGRCHVYKADCKQLNTALKLKEVNAALPTSTTEKTHEELDLQQDEFLMMKELDEAQNILKQLQDILTNFYPSDDVINNHLMPEIKVEDYVSSKQWLIKYGLKAQKLQFYDVFADCAFRHSDGVVDIKTKPEDESMQTDADTKMKLINAKYCDQFVHTQWKDGSVVHLYITKEKWRWYEERMKTVLEQMERRIQWLQQGSRELFGTILEDRVYILIDTSHSMKDKLFLVKEKMFQLIEEQLKHKLMFNFVKFDSKVEAWKSRLAKVTEDTLQEASCWVKELQVGSSTNTLRALQVAFNDSSTEAIYLLTDGRPDQPAETILAQVNFQKSVPIHTISFSCNDVDANSFLYQLSCKTEGRFHCYTSNLRDPKAPQPFVSEDICLLQNEIKQGKADLQKVQKFYTECLILDWYHNGDKETPYKSNHEKAQPVQEMTTASTPLHRQMNTSLRQLRRKKTRHAECNIIDSNTSLKKSKKSPKDCLDMSSSRWLKIHGLVARRLTIMDSLAPTTVPHTAKYVPILDKHIFSKVFDEVLPLAHISGDNKHILLVNPKAVNLEDYKHKLEKAVTNYERRLNLVIWRALSQEERDKFQSDVPVSYMDNKEAFLQALDRLGWPITSEDVTLLEDEINTGKTYFNQACLLQEAIKNNASKELSNQKEEKKQIHQKITKKPWDSLRGQKVIARSDIDGFYYQGTVLRSTSSKCALVDFNHGENQIVPTNFIIRRGGAVPCPSLKVGDFVFSKTRARSGCYVPAVVIATPRMEAIDKLYTVLKYNNRKEHCLRSELIKINQSLFTFACRYIREAQMVDHTIPSVQFVKPIPKPTPIPGEKKRKAGKARENRSKENQGIGETDENPLTKAHSENQSVMSQSPVSHSSRDSASEVEDNVFDSEKAKLGLPQDPLSPLTPVPSILQSSQKATPRSSLSSITIRSSEKPQSINISKKLEKLIFEITEFQQKQREKQQSVQEYLKQLIILKSHQDKCGLEEEQRDHVKQQIDLLQQLRMLTPISSIQQTKSDLHSSLINKSQSYKCPLVPGQNVLARSSYTGWYEKGTVIHDCGDFSYFIKRSSGEIARMWREDVFSDTDDYEKDIKDSDPVIVAHPLHEGCYCPGVVLKVMADLKLVVKYYDKTEDLVPREQVFLTTIERFERDTTYITECEERWVSQPVVARNDTTGTFQLAEVQKRIGNGKQYIICWADGKTARQDIAWIFGKFSQPHVLKVGAHVLTLANPSSLTFLPGIITGYNGARLKVTFCNGNSCQNVEPPHCFGLSEKKFSMAVAFFHQQQNHEKDGSVVGSDTENEDSLSEISSITLSSSDSESEKSD
ncbi:von Willebrand factor A domain-containing protein 3B isoform X2 [Xenopus tropicalis]|uniref:von Willebrand factor A domain-containing 3B n=1 Tax=Xenopus tropicalis TaxID=8364 RepID=A0A6I8SKD4_XENTR|nr:von Willebrand factor A domain-containing protein 3B isoform X2 [Xenopus tropicalis]